MYSCVLDDRTERAGVKFNDFELIGVPIRVTVGRGIEQGKVEVQLRKNEEKFEVEIEKAKDYIKELIKNY